MKQVICLGTPLQIAAVVGGLVFRDGMGDPINLPPCLDDLRVLSMPNSTRQLISLHRNWRDDDGILHSSAWAVTAVGMGADKSTLEIFDNEPHWERIADAWAWLVSELAARGRIEGGPAEQQSATAGEAAAVIDAALPETDPDDIPRWGRRRDLSTREVREIVRRCKAYQAAGGSIAKFRAQESMYWPDPNDSPRSYSVRTLEAWMRDARFQG